MSRHPEADSSGSAGASTRTTRPGRFVRVGRHLDATVERIDVRWADGSESTLTGVAAGSVEVVHKPAS